MKFDKDTLAWIGYFGGAFAFVTVIFIGWIYVAIEAEKMINAWMPY